MNLLSMIASLRKFGNFVVGLFPVVGTLVSLLGSPLRQLVKSSPWLNSRVRAVQNKFDALAQIKAVKAATPAVQRFYWKDYGRDRLDINSLPPGSLSVLRPLFLVTVTLCILIPVLCLAGKPQVSLTTVSGVTCSAPVWSVYLWLVAAALAWGFLLAGAAICNRLFFCFACVIYISLFGACAFFADRSYANALIPLAVFFATAQSAASLKASGARAWQGQLMARLAAFVVGAPAGIYLIALTPMQPFFKPLVWQWGALIGSLLALSITNFFSNINLRRTLSTAASAAVLSTTTLIFLISLALRGGLSALAGQFISEMSLWNGYLWPVWYFVGIGIVFKLLKNTKVITRSLKDSMPVPLYHIFVIALIVFAAVLNWRSGLVDFALAAHVLENPAVWLYKNTVWFWNKPINAFSAAVLKWIFLFDLFAIAWLVIKGKWNSERAGAVLYFSALSWFGVSEYMFQWLSFGRSPAHSIILVTSFSMWLIWLLHTVGLEMSLQNSRTFPARGRLAIYGSIVVFALLEIHARTALGDFRVMNEIFLYMFRGIIDVGLPYFLYVFACRRFDNLPLAVGRIFKIFCLGALLTYPLNVLDKLALGGWTVSGLQAVWAEELATFTNQGYICAHEPNLALISLVLRATCFVSVLTLIAFRVALTSRSPGAIVFAALAFASGFASFSKTIVDLPLPDNLRVLVAPFHTSLFFDYHLMALYLSAGISALSFSLIVISKSKNDFCRSPARWAYAAAIAFIIDLFITWAWPGQEVWLRSSGIIATGTVIGGVIFIYLLIYAMSFIENVGRANDQSVISQREVNVLAAVVLTVLLYVAFTQSGQAMMRTVSLSALKLSVPVRFGQAKVSADGKSALYNFKDRAGIVTLAVSQMDTEGRDLKAAMMDLVAKTIQSHALNDFAVVGMEDWHQWVRGALALRFNYNLPDGTGGKIAMTGITVLVPAAEGKLISYYCLSASPVDMDERRFDLIRIVQH